MSVQYVASFSSKAYIRQIFIQKLRTNLLGLEQLEEIYSLASWIRRLFSKVLEKPTTSRQRTQNTSQEDLASSCVHGETSHFSAAKPLTSHTVSDPGLYLPHLPSTAHRPSESVPTTMAGAGTAMSVAIDTRETLETYPSPNSQGDPLLASIWSDDACDLTELEGQFLTTNPPLNWPLLSPLEHENMRLLGLVAEFPCSY